MGATPNFNLPFPDGGELLDSVSIMNLAMALDSYLYDFEGTKNPTMITLPAINGWEVITGGNAGEPLRLFRMGRLFLLQGEVIYRPAGVATGDKVPSAKTQICTIPAGWRPAVRSRAAVIRTSGSPMQELYVNTDGAVKIPDALAYLATPGYAISASWVGAAV